MTAARHHAGYTLIELITVMLIIGILVGVAAPSFLEHGSEADAVATAQHLKTIALAAEMYYNDSGVWPVDTVAGAKPTALEPYLRPDLFALGCPLGGEYDWDRDRHGVAAAVKIVAPPPSDEMKLEIDRHIDDGSLETGFVVDDNGFKLILER